jgi:hypothetical protein
MKLKKALKNDVPLYVIISNCRHLIIIHINYSLFIFIHLSLAPDLCWSLLISQTVAGGGPMVGLLTSLSETQRQHEALCGEARPVRLRTRPSQMPEVRRVKEASSPSPGNTQRRYARHWWMFIWFIYVHHNLPNQVKNLWNNQMSGGQNYLYTVLLTTRRLLVKDMAKVGGLLSVVKVFTQVWIL